jgi:hypothetical protein
MTFPSLLCHLVFQVLRLSNGFLSIPLVLFKEFFTVGQMEIRQLQIYRDCECPKLGNFSGRPISRNRFCLNFGCTHNLLLEITLVYSHCKYCCKQFSETFSLEIGMCRETDHWIGMTNKGIRKFQFFGLSIFNKLPQLLYLFSGTW